MKLTTLFENKEKDQIGIFIPLPPKLGKQFPSKKEDKSPVHITILFIGDLAQEEYDKVVKLTKKVAKKLKPIKIDVTDYGEFYNDDGEVISHMIPRAHDINLEEINQMLTDACEKEGIKVKHHDGPFKAHVTLAYDKRSKKRPCGSFTAKNLEVWSKNFGNVKVPLEG